MTETFMQALQQAEQTGNVDALVALFADGSTLENLTSRRWEGQDGARDFWSTYLGNFESIRSEFTHHSESGGYGVMEWVARGQLKDGQPIEYRGVSIIETAGNKISAFRTFYDSAAFVQPETQTESSEG